MVEKRYLKKAIRDIDRSSCGVRDDAKMDRRTAGVTGIRLDESDGDCWTVGTECSGLAVGVEDTDVEEDMGGHAIGLRLTVRRGSP